MGNNACCRINNAGEYCRSGGSNDGCFSCPIEFTEDGLRPLTDTFMKYLQHFLTDIPSQTCSKAGHAAYSDVRDLFEFAKFPLLNLFLSRVLTMY